MEITEKNCLQVLAESLALTGSSTESFEISAKIPSDMPIESVTFECRAPRKGHKTSSKLAVKIYGKSQRYSYSNYRQSNVLEGYTQCHSFSIDKQKIMPFVKSLTSYKEYYRLALAMFSNYTIKLDKHSLQLLVDMPFGDKHYIGGIGCKNQCLDKIYLPKYPCGFDESENLRLVSENIYKTTGFGRVNITNIQVSEGLTFIGINWSYTAVLADDGSMTLCMNVLPKDNRPTIDGKLWPGPAVPLFSKDRVQIEKQIAKECYGQIRKR